MVFNDAAQGWAVTGCGSIMKTTDGGLSWEVISGPDSTCNDLYDIVITSQGSLIASGAGGRIIRSTDQGESWSVMSFPGAGRLYDLAMIPGGGISAAGENGVLLVSFNDGNSWNDIGPGGSGYARHHVWKSASECFIAGSGLFHRTTDGGNTWIQVATPGFFGLNEIYFVNENTGFAIEDFAFWKTTDGGNSWIKNDVFTEPLYRFRTVVLDEMHWFSVGFGEGGELWETIDGGLNWDNKMYYNSTGFPCLERSGDRLLFGSDLGDVFFTDDGGVTVQNAVQNLAVFPSAPVNTIGKRPDGTLFANNQPNSGVDNGTFFRSDDGGKSWYVPEPSPGLRWVNDIRFYDDQHGVLGSYGDIRFTTDGGNSWSESSLAEGFNLTSFALPRPDRYFAGTYAGYPNSGGNLFKSSDQGATWQIVAGGLPVNQVYVSNIAFVDENTGYLACLVNNLPEIYRTEDGGETWSMIDQNGLPSFVADMVWLDENTGIAGVPNGENSGIYRTTDGGLNWTRVSDSGARSLTSGSDQSVGAMDTYDTFFQDSRDGGLTWTSYAPPFSSANAGNQGYVESIQAIDNGYIIGGAGNKLLVAERSVATGVEGNGEASLTGQAMQNLTVIPNPVKEHADIRMVLEQESFVTLSLYDAQGRLLHVFRQQFMPKGTHLIPVNAGASGLSLKPGIYFVSLQTGNSFNSVKMIVAE